MNFEVYCDESRPDLFASRNPKAEFLVIGSLWLQREDRSECKAAIHALRDKYRVGGEFKWQKVSPSRFEFYRDLVEWFIAAGQRLRFRCIAVEHTKVDLVHYHDDDQELGFYKFYYQMLRHWITNFNEYSIFCDAKKNRDPNRLRVLRRCLDLANLCSTVTCVQAIRSNESVLIQLADVLTGIASTRLNRTHRPQTAKTKLLDTLEAGLGKTLQRTLKAEQKFNVFVIDPTGGW